MRWQDNGGEGKPGWIRKLAVGVLTAKVSAEPGF